jgi:hypothetical protein
MDEINKFDNRQLTEAVLLWTGWKQTAIPRRDDSLLVARFGSELASKLLAAIKSLEDDFYLSEAKYVASDLKEMEAMSAEQFKNKYPKIDDEIVKAFAWCYTFDFK